MLGRTTIHHRHDRTPKQSNKTYSGPKYGVSKKLAIGAQYIVVSPFSFVFSGCLTRHVINAARVVPTSYPGLSISNPGAGGKVLYSDWPTKTHSLRPKILESFQINIAKTNFRAFRQFSAKQQTSIGIIILQQNYFPRITTLA